MRQAGDRLLLVPPNAPTGLSLAKLARLVVGPCARLWRRGRGSNPRYGCPYAAFRVRCFQLLSHLSAGRLVDKAMDERRAVF